MLPFLAISYHINSTIMPKKSRVGARKYKTVSCHTTKTAAKSAAKRLRASGKTATVASKNKDGKYCVKSAGMKRGRKKK